MPWKTATPMEEITRFVVLARSGRFTVTELCEQFGVSRKTGYKYLERYAAEGVKGAVEGQRQDLGAEVDRVALEAAFEQWDEGARRAAWSSYAEVSSKMLNEIHTRTHPAPRLPNENKSANSTP